jgi:hypothetical protein
MIENWRRDVSIEVVHVMITPKDAQVRSICRSSCVNRPIEVGIISTSIQLRC